MTGNESVEKREKRKKRRHVREWSEIIYSVPNGLSDRHWCLCSRLDRSQIPRGEELRREVRSYFSSSSPEQSARVRHEVVRRCILVSCLRVVYEDGLSRIIRGVS